MAFRNALYKMSDCTYKQATSSCGSLWQKLSIGGILWQPVDGSCQRQPFFTWRCCTQTSFWKAMQVQHSTQQEKKPGVNYDMVHKLGLKCEIPECRRAREKLIPWLDPVISCLLSMPNKTAIQTVQCRTKHTDTHTDMQEKKWGLLPSKYLRRARWRQLDKSGTRLSEYWKITKEW